LYVAEIATCEKRGLTPLSLFDPLKCGTVVGFNIPPRGLEHLAPRDNNDINTGQRFVDSKELSHQPFRPISRYRIPDFPASGDAEPRGTNLVWQGETRDELAAKADASIVDLGELRPAAQFHRDDDTVNRLRPLARLRLRTIRPFFVCIRTRNP
jgi:hypothetical protein